MEAIKRTKVLNKIDEAGDGIFEVTFKKVSGELRTMRCRQHVEHNLKGGTNRVVKPSNDYVTMFDVDKEAYRTVNLATTKTIVVNGRDYEVID